LVIALVSLLIAVSVGLIIKYLFLRGFDLDGSSKILRAIIVILLLGGIVLTVNSSLAVKEKLADRSWPIAKGVVLSAEIVGEKSSRPQIIYEYEAGGEIRLDTSDLGAPGFGSRWSRLEVAAATIDQYPPGSDLTVHYDPDNPGDSTIRLSLGWDNLGKLGLGMTLIIVNMVVMLSFRRKSITSNKLID